MQAQKIVDLKAASPESLWQFLMTLPGSFEAQVFYLILSAGILGVFFNYAVKWMKGEITGNLIDYLFIDNVRGTLLSITLTIGMGVAGIASGMFEESDGQFIGWFKALLLAFANGYFWDTVANKGKT